MSLMAHTYSHLYGLRPRGLRFIQPFYGPWGRPDMAADASRPRHFLSGERSGCSTRGGRSGDFTLHRMDIVEGVLRLLDKPATA